LPGVKEVLSYLGMEPGFGGNGRGAWCQRMGTTFCKTIGKFVTRDIGVGGGPYSQEAPAVVAESLGLVKGIAGKLVVVFVVGKCLYC
jgi:hypothetical protein